MWLVLYAGLTEELHFDIKNSGFISALPPLIGFIVYTFHLIRQIPENVPMRLGLMLFVGNWWWKLVGKLVLEIDGGAGIDTIRGASDPPYQEWQVLCVARQV